MDQAHVNLGRILWEERKKIFLLMGKMEPTPYRIAYEREFELEMVHGILPRDTA